MVKFSATYQVTGNTGKHVDDLRSVDTPYFSKGYAGIRATIIQEEKVKAFDEFAEEAAMTKRRQDLALMIDIMGRI